MHLASGPDPYSEDRTLPFTWQEVGRMGCSHAEAGIARRTIRLCFRSEAASQQLALEKEGQYDRKCLYLATE